LFLIIISYINIELYNIIYDKLIIEIFTQCVNFPEIIYFFFMIYYIIQYLLIYRNKYIEVKNGIIEIILFLFFGLLPIYYEILKIKKEIFYLENN